MLITVGVVSVLFAVAVVSSSFTAVNLSVFACPGHRQFAIVEKLNKAVGRFVAEPNLTVATADVGGYFGRIKALLPTALDINMPNPRGRGVKLQRNC